MRRESWLSITRLILTTLVTIEKELGDINNTGDNRVPKWVNKQQVLMLCFEKKTELLKRKEKQENAMRRKSNFSSEKKNKRMLWEENRTSQAKRNIID